MNEVVATGDRDLWAAAVGGDADAFGALFERHSRAVYNFAFRGTADWAAAEDMASEVFLTAWRRRSQVVFTTESGSVLPWLLGVATNHLRNQRRGKRRADAAIARLNRNEDPPDFSDDVLGRMADEAQMAEVQTVVEQLPAHERRPCALRLGRARLRGGGDCAGGAGRNDPLATFARPYPPVGTRRSERT